MCILFRPTKKRIIVIGYILTYYIIIIISRNLHIIHFYKYIYNKKKTIIWHGPRRAGHLVIYNIVKPYVFDFFS